MRKDRIPMVDGDEVDVFGVDWFVYAPRPSDSGFRKQKARIKRGYNRRLRRAGKEECK
jgi:hypothetical protein